MASVEQVLLRQLYNEVLSKVGDEEQVTTAMLASWHRRWLGNVYAWAGAERTVNVSKDGFAFATAAYLPELLQGFDTATQITALAHWFRHQPSPRIARVWIATDPDHTARAVVLARIALGSQGIRVGPADLPPSSPSEHRKLLRDALRLKLWRATGSTGAWLAPEIVARKRADCGVLAGDRVKAARELFRLQVVRALLV